MGMLEKSVFYRSNEGTKKKVPDRPYTIKEAADYAGRPGGPERAPSDGPPGVKAIWAGLQKPYTLLDYRELFDDGHRVPGVVT
jgi:hypothetical protein